MDQPIKVRHKEFTLTQDLVAKKILRNTRITAQLIEDILEFTCENSKNS